MNMPRADNHTFSLLLAINKHEICWIKIHLANVHDQQTSLHKKTKNPLMSTFF